MSLNSPAAAESFSKPTCFVSECGSTGSGFDFRCLSRAAGVETFARLVRLFTGLLRRHSNRMSGRSVNAHLRRLALSDGRCAPRLEFSR